MMLPFSEYSQVSYTSSDMGNFSGLRIRLTTLIFMALTRECWGDWGTPRRVTWRLLGRSWAWGFVQVSKDTPLDVSLQIQTPNGLQTAPR